MYNYLNTFCSILYEDSTFFTSIYDLKYINIVSNCCGKYFIKDWKGGT